MDHEECPTSPSPGNGVRVEGSWLVIECPDNPTIRLDARVLDRVLAADDDLILAIGELTPILEVPDGAARRIASQLAPFTRSAPIDCVDSYEDAKRRLAGSTCPRASNPPPALLYGDAVVRASDTILYVGDFACSISDVELYAEVGANLPLQDGELQAALAMLIVAARRRREDLTTLARRIEEYEALAAERGQARGEGAP